MDRLRIGDLERRLSNMVRPGNVIEADYAKARVRVKMGENISAWLPWIAERAGDNRTWNPPSVGEQVLVIAPCGELANAFVLAGGIYKKDRPANGDKATISRTTFEDGAVSEYDRATHTQLIKVPSNGKVVIQVGETKITLNNQRIKLSSPKAAALTIDENGVTILGRVKIVGEVIQGGGALKSNNVTLHSHAHGGVTSGSGASGPPLPL